MGLAQVEIRLTKVGQANDDGAKNGPTSQMSKPRTIAVLGLARSL